jgi:hypothetical protein
VTAGRSTGAGPLLLIAALSLAASLGASCARGAAARAPAPPGAPDMTTPLFAGGGDGVEVQWWIVADDGSALARLMAPRAGRASPLAPALVGPWRANGLRLLATDIADLPAIQAGAPAVGRVNRSWLGQAPRWTVAVQGDEWLAPRSLLIDGELVRLPAGRLRLLTRAWVAPTERGPRLRVDLAVQFAEAAARPREDVFGDARLRLVEDDGLVFETLTASLEMQDGEACVIVAESPMVDWSSAAPPGASAQRGGDESGRTDGDAPRPDDGPQGPEAPATPTIGEAMLSMTPQLPTPDRPTPRRPRAVVVITARVTERFALP